MSLTFILSEKCEIYTFPSKSVTVGPGMGWFIVLNDPASPKMVIKLYFNFFQFFKGFRAV